MISIGIIGVGRLGICTALLLEKAGYNVICYDVSSATCDAINKRVIISSEKGVSEMLEKARNIRAVYSLQEIMDLDIFFCVVPTPSLPDGSYNHSYIEEVTDKMIPFLSKSGTTRKIFNVCSTTMPGYCDTLQTKFRENDLNVDVCYNPEFIAQGNIIHGFTHPDLLLLGEATKESGDILLDIYKTFIKTTPAVCRMTRKEAEITKISINCFITTKISFANTIGDLCIHEGLNADRVLKAIGSDSRIGNKYLNWGHGYGGPCFPRDNRALCLYSSGQAVKNRIGEATDETNAAHLQFLVDTLSTMAKETGKQFLFRDLTYKPGTTIIEESQSLALANQLDFAGFTIYIQESPEIQKMIETLYPSQFLFVDSTINSQDYIVVDKDLSCLRIRM